MMAIRIFFKTMLRDRDFRVLLLAAGLGVFVGVLAAFGWAKETPAALGFFTFAGALFGARAGR